jgi:pyruvate/2-oxoglutarate dehydrogenase complex dihydrolipoamide dehydrogenase (E3) component
MGRAERPAAPAEPAAPPSLPSPAGAVPFPVEPLDEHNRELLANVQPVGWRNPEPAARYHLVVLGAGTAGLVAAAGAAGLGARVALVERHLMGGDCLNVGCVPSKALIRAADAWHEARQAAERFGGPAAAGTPSFAAAMERMRRLRAGLSPHDGAARFRGLGVDVFLGDGRFVARDAVEVAGHRLRFRRAVVATGTRPAVPTVAGLEEAGYRTNETLFDLTELPRRLAILGAGPIGCEMAQAFARFGSAVTLIERGSQILPREDADAAAIVAAALERDGVRLELGVELAAARRAGAERLLELRPAGGGGEHVRPGNGGGWRQLAVDEILVATGRLPNVEGIDLEVAGISWTPRGVEVDDRLRTANPRVFACGDVASPLRFTHAADAQARLVVQNALFFGRAKASALTIPWCTFTHPEIAHVGCNEHEARARGLTVETLTVPLADNDRAVLDGETEGFLRLHLKRGTDVILGATLVAAHAGDIIGEICLAMARGIGLGAIAGVVHPYPTQAEVVKRAADTWRRGKLTPAVRRLLGGWFRLFS